MLFGAGGFPFHLSSDDKVGWRNMRTVENIYSTWMEFFEGRVLENSLYLTSAKILELIT